MATRRRAAAAPAPEEEVYEELDDIEELADPEAEDADDLEELEEAPAPQPTKRTRAAKAAKAAPPTKSTKAAPAKRAAAPAPDAEMSEYDSNWLAGYVTEETGVEYDSRGIRMLLRKLARNGAFSREIGTDRQRYVFPKGANDQIVKAVVRMVKSGEATTVKQEGLNAVKATKAATKTAPAKATKAAPAKAAPTKAATRRRRAAAE